MRVLRVICLAVAFRSISAVPLDGSNQSYNADERNVKRETYHDQQPESLASSQVPTSTTMTTTVSPDGRAAVSTSNPATGSPNLPTRHGKHRRRHRCKNRPACPTATTPSTRPRFYLSSSSSSLAARSGKEMMLAASQRALSNQSSSSSSVLENADAKRSMVADVTVANANDSALKLIDKRSNKPSGYATDGRIPADADPRTPTRGNDESALFDPGRFEEIDAYDENDFEDVDVLSWSGTRFASDYADAYDAPSSPVNVDYRLPFYGGLSAFLTRLFQSLRNVSAENSHDMLKKWNFIPNTDEDPCQKWANSWDRFERAFLGFLVGLPACPCQYPSNIFYDDKIWDETQRRYFRWRDVSGGSQRLDVYKPGAAYCVRSLPGQGSKSPAAQHCCYDNSRRMLTRGSGAATPNFVSPEISARLHEKIDVLPWRLCKGDFSRFNKVRPPNNDNGCETNPDDEEYQRQINNTKYY